MSESKKSKRKLAKYTPEQRRFHLDAYRASGLTLEGYCKTAGVKYTTLTNWLYRKNAPIADAPVVVIPWWRRMFKWVGL